MTRKINREGVAGYIEDLSLFYRAFAEAKRKSRGRQQQDVGRLSKRRLSRHKTHTHVGYHSITAAFLAG